MRLSCLPNPCVTPPYPCPTRWTVHTTERRQTANSWNLASDGLCAPLLGSHSQPYVQLLHSSSPFLCFHLPLLTLCPAWQIALPTQAENQRTETIKTSSFTDTLLPSSVTGRCLSPRKMIPCVCFAVTFLLTF